MLHWTPDTFRKASFRSVINAMVGYRDERTSQINHDLRIAAIHAAWVMNVHLPKGKRITAKQLLGHTARINKLPPGKTAAERGQELVELAAKWRRERAEKERAIRST